MLSEVRDAPRHTVYRKTNDPYSAPASIKGLKYIYIL
jgi:hypothetical protein